MKKLVSLAALCAVAFSADARSQLIVANDDAAAGATTAWSIDVSTCATTPLWTDVETWGAAADDTNGIVYVNDGSVLYAWPYNSPAPPMSIGTITSTADGNAVNMVSLAFANGLLYGTRNISSGANPEALYEIDPATQLCTLKLAYNTADYDFGGLSFNPADGLFYGTNDDSSPFGYGLYSIDGLGAGTISFVVAYPPGENDIDGLAIGNNVAYLVEDEPSPVHTYDLATGTFDPTPCSNPMTSSEVFSGGAWAPGLGGGCPSLATYCTAKVTSNGCTPAIGSVGTPSKTGGPGTFDVTLGATRPNKAYIYFYSVNTARNAAPFQGGFLCMQPPVRRTPVVFTAGASACDGTASRDFGAIMATAAFIDAGDVIRGEWWGRDTPGNSSLSDAIEFTVCP